jgi:hypothetical protein
LLGQEKLQNKLVAYFNGKTFKMNEKRKFRKGFRELLKATTEIKEKKQEISSDDGDVLPIIRPIRSPIKVQKIIEIQSSDDEHEIEGDPEVTTKRQKLGGPVLRLNYHIVIVVRGDITERIYSTWIIQLPKKLTAYTFTFSKQYLNEDDCIIVAASNITSSCFLSWLGTGTSLSSSDKVKVVSSEWIITAIKNSVFPLFDDYRIYPLAANVKSENNTDDHEVAEEDGLERKKKGSFHPAYACINTGEYKTLNPNKYITDILEELQSIYELCGDEWRALGYKKCVGTLKQLPRITNIEQLKGIKGIGDSIRDKIHEILETGKLQKLKYFKDDPKIKSMIELSKIWGVGDKTALKLIKQGYKSVKDLRSKGQHILTFQQKIGLKYYEEFMAKIPKTEIEEILEIVTEHCSR